MTTVGYTRRAPDEIIQIETVITYLRDTFPPSPS